MEVSQKKGSGMLNELKKRKRGREGETGERKE